MAKLRVWLAGSRPVSNGCALNFSMRDNDGWCNRASAPECRCQVRRHLHRRTVRLIMSTRRAGMAAPLPFDAQSRSSPGDEVTAH